MLTTSAPGPVLSVEGEYNNDVLEGRGVVYFRNGERMNCSFEDNSIHGHAVLFAGNGSVKQVGKVWSGVQTGLQWNFLEGGGFVVGKVCDVAGVVVVVSPLKVIF